MAIIEKEDADNDQALTILRNLNKSHRLQPSKLKRQQKKQDLRQK